MRTEGTTTIAIDYDLPHPPAKVWRALTEPALLGAWLMSNDFKPEVGHKFTFHAPPVPHWDGIVSCEVLAVEPQRRLRYLWRGGSGEHRLDTIVEWTLTPDGAGTRLHLEHSGFDSRNTLALEGLGKGWRGHVAQRMRAELDRL